MGAPAAPSGYAPPQAAPPQAAQVSLYGQGFVIVQPSEGIQVATTA
jgi:hypothetical protein